jgi:hypothetical protein
MLRLGKKETLHQVCFQIAVSASFPVMYLPVLLSLERFKLHRHRLFVPLFENSAQ